METLTDFPKIECPLVRKIYPVNCVQILLACGWAIAFYFHAILWYVNRPL